MGSRCGKINIEHLKGTFLESFSDQFSSTNHKSSFLSSTISHISSFPQNTYLLPINFFPIDKSVYISGMITCENHLTTLKTVFNIGYIITCTISPLQSKGRFVKYHTGPYQTFIDIDIGLDKEGDITTVHIPFIDHIEAIPSIETLKRLIPIYEEMATSKKSILFHCWSGCFRSNLMGFIYLQYMKIRGLLTKTTTINDEKLENRKSPKCSLENHHWKYIEMIYKKEKESGKIIVDEMRLKNNYYLTIENDILKTYEVLLDDNPIDPIYWESFSETSITIRISNYNDKKKNIDFYVEEKKINFSENKEKIEKMKLSILKLKVCNSDDEFEKFTNFVKYEKERKGLKKRKNKSFTTLITYITKNNLVDQIFNYFLKTKFDIISYVSNEIEYFSTQKEFLQLLLKVKSDEMKKSDLYKDIEKKLEEYKTEGLSKLEIFDTICMKNEFPKIEKFLKSDIDLLTCKRLGKLFNELTKQKNFKCIKFLMKNIHDKRFNETKENVLFRLIKFRHFKNFEKLLSVFPVDYEFSYKKSLKIIYELILQSRLEELKCFTKFRSISKCLVDVDTKLIDSKEVREHVIKSTSGLNIEKVKKKLFFFYCYNGSIKEFERLIDLGYPVNHPEDITGLYPIQILIKNGHIEMVKSLLENNKLLLKNYNKVSVENACKGDITSLASKIQYCEKLVFMNGGDESVLGITKKLGDGNIEKVDTVYCHFQNGYKKFLGIMNERKKIRKLFKESKDFQDENKLLYSCFLGDDETAKNLIQKNKTINIKTKDFYTGYTPFHYTIDSSMKSFNLKLFIYLLSLLKFDIESKCLLTILKKFIKKKEEFISKLKISENLNTEMIEKLKTFLKQLLTIIENREKKMKI